VITTSHSQLFRRRLFHLALLGLAAPLLSAALLQQSGSPEIPARVPSNIVWNEQTIASAKAGNAIRGLVLARRCERCHGAEGFSPDASTPNLAGMDRLSLWKELNDFRDGKRQSRFMQPIAAALMPPDYADLAAYYSMLPTYPDPMDTRAFPQAPTGSFPNARPARLVAGGDGSRGIPPCQACHGPLATKNGAPSLETQNSDYIQEQLNAFAVGTRTNDIDMPMRAIARLLTAEERQALAAYYGSGQANFQPTPASNPNP
jgi:cytochrome c553